MKHAIEGIGVVIPARDEEELLPRALEALRRARSALGSALSSHAPWVRVVLVLDDCSDASLAVAESYDDIEVLSVNFGQVGAARREGIRHLLDRCDAPTHSVWIANTDADSEVPAHWLSEQWRLATSGVELMIGTVSPDFADLTSERRERWLATHTPGHANGHVHGANLGFRADRYEAVGGFAAIAEHEDVLLVEAMQQAGARAVATATCDVLTSGRIFGRTPGGYASHMRERL